MSVKNKVFVILAVVCLILSSCKSGLYRFDSQLERVDSFLLFNPSMAKDSLNMIRYADLSEEDAAYLQLLRTIVGEIENPRVEYSSEIKNMHDVFTRMKQKGTISDYDYLRSRLYYSIAAFYANPLDTALCKDLGVLVSSFRGMDSLNYYYALSAHYHSRSAIQMNDLPLALDAIEKSLSVPLPAGADTTLAYASKMYKARIFIAQKKLAMAKNVIFEMEPDRISNLNTKYSLCRLYSDYYSVSDIVDKALQYLQEAYKIYKYGVMLHDEAVMMYDEALLLNDIASLCIRNGQFDKAEMWASMALKVPTNDKSDEYLHMLYVSLAHIYYLQGKYVLAADAYKQAYNAAFAYISPAARRHAQSMKVIYDRAIEESLAKMDKLNDQRYFYMIAASGTLLLIVLLLAVYRSKLHKARRKTQDLEQVTLKSELQQSKVMIDVVSLSLGILPEFVGRVNDLSSKLFSTDPELYDTFQKEINAVRGETRKRLLEIVNSDAVISVLPELKSMTFLSNQEKMILFLLCKDYIARDIANILNISQSSVRASKVKIKQKILSSDIETATKSSLLEKL